MRPSIRGGFSNADRDGAAPLPAGGVPRPRTQAYREHSAATMAVLAGFADVLEQVSIDEAYLVVSAHPGSVTEVLAAVVDAVWQGTGLRVSVGAGRSKLVAKLGSTAAKPRGQRVNTRSQEQEFLDVLPVAALRGSGRWWRPAYVRWVSTRWHSCARNQSGYWSGCSVPRAGQHGRWRWARTAGRLAPRGR